MATVQIRRQVCYSETMLMLSPKTEALARQLADINQVSVDTVIRRALEAETDRNGHAQPAKDMSAAAIADRTARSLDLAKAIATLPVLDRRSPEEIMDELNRS